MPTLFEAIGKRYVSCRQNNYIIDKISIIIFIVCFECKNNFTQFFVIFYINYIIFKCFNTYEQGGMRI